MKDGRVLAIKRGPGVLLPGYWTLPSGRIERGETQRAALIREIDEELGLAVAPIAKVWECPTDDGAWKLHWWTAAMRTDQLFPDENEVAETRWVTPEEFLKLEPIFEGDREFFERVLPTLDLASSDL
ncbi:MAG: NUDIX domain-containing protein [Actinomycetota bacterium]|nr:NUDIX domain-containing protein [Actinomycetota bacterium]